MAAVRVKAFRPALHAIAMHAGRARLNRRTRGEEANPNQDLFLLYCKMPFISGIAQNNKLYIFLCYILCVYLFVVELFCLVARFTGEVDTDSCGRCQ